MLKRVVKVALEFIVEKSFVYIILLTHFGAKFIEVKMFSIKLMFVLSALLVVLVNCDPTMYKKNEQNVYEAGELFNKCRKLY